MGQRITLKRLHVFISLKARIFICGFLLFLLSRNASFHLSNAISPFWVICSLFMGVSNVLHFPSDLKYREIVPLHVCNIYQNVVRFRLCKFEIFYPGTV